jgi:hypothetical protein
MNEQNNEQHPGEIPVVIDNRPYKAPRTPMTGAELKRLANIGCDYDLWFETPGPSDDRKIGDEERFPVRPGNHFYSAPRTINPGARP